MGKFWTISSLFISVVFPSAILTTLEKKKWSKVEVKSPVTPKGLWGASAVTINNSMVLFGGMDAVGNYSNDLYQFDFGNSFLVTMVTVP
jgi:N-acetylneuraminic acid mutarotase